MAVSFLTCELGSSLGWPQEEDVLIRQPNVPKTDWATCPPEMSSPPSFPGRISGSYSFDWWRWQAYSARAGDKMGSGEPVVEKQPGNRVPIDQNGWALDESGFRRMGSEEAREERSSRTSALAVLSLVLALLSELLSRPDSNQVFFIGFFLLPPAAVVLGVIALVQIRRSFEMQGRGIAFAGILLGAAITLWHVLLWGAIQSLCFDATFCT